MRNKIVVRATSALIGAACGCAVGWLFYRHMLPCLMLAALCAAAAVPALERHVHKRRQREWLQQFRQFLYALSTLLAAGHSIENALAQSERDLRLMFSFQAGGLVDELAAANRKVANGMPPEKALAEFGQRTGLADIRHFNEVLRISKRSGGDIIDLIRRTAAVIAEKIEIEQDIQVMTAQKSFEAKAMAVVPFALVGLMAISSPDYMAPLYEGIGRLIMTAVLVLLGLCLWWILSIMRIKV